MIFYGISKVFSTENEEQYNTIGSFWDEMANQYGRENLRGLGYNWTENTIEYVIGLKEGIIDSYNCMVELPDEGWMCVTGRLDNLGKIYGEIYEEGCLTYEIESFSNEGDCEILYYR